jgi:transposase
MDPKHTIGIDLGDKHSHYCVLDDAGVIVDRGRICTTPAGVANAARKWPPARVAIEVGTHSRWFSEVLESAGHAVIIANPRRLKLITESLNKHDKADAALLARLARADADLLAPVQHRTRQEQAHLAIIRARDALVRTRGQLINCVRGLVKPFGARLPSCSTTCFAMKSAPHLPDELRSALAPLLTEIDSLTEAIWAYDLHLEHVALTRYPETARLKQVAGIGTLSALTFMLCIGDPHRFQRSREVGCYLGLKPRQKQSGHSAPELGITKCGNELLRRTLVQSAHYILGPFGPDTDLRRWGLKLAGQSKRAKKRALIAVARKLAILLHRLWISGEAYQPVRTPDTTLADCAA